MQTFEKIFAQGQLLADHIRIEAYKKAVSELVRPGDVVVDLGCGNGILSFFAARAGASRVYAIEGNGALLKETQRLARWQKLDMTFVHGWSHAVDLPEKADVVISEILGYWGIDEDVLYYLPDARKRFLKPEGRLLPQELELWLIPVESEYHRHRLLGFWDAPFFDGYFQPVRTFAASKTYVADLSRNVRWLGAPFRCARFDFAQEPVRENTERSAALEAHWQIEETGAIHGYCGFFRARLSPSVSLSTHPEEAGTHWKQYFFPLEDEITVQKNDVVSCQMRLTWFDERPFWQWKTTHERDAAVLKKYSQSNFNVSPKLVQASAQSSRGR